MIKRKKILKKLLAIFLAYLLIFNPMVAPIIWAEDGSTGSPEEPQAEEQVVQEEQPQEESQDQSDEEASGQSEDEAQDEGDSTITTGDAESQAEVETIANTHEDIIPGEISASEGSCTPPEGETDCPDGVEISNDNLADVSDEADSTATTGDNLIEGTAGDALIDTGEATAGASIENEINTNVVVFEDGEDAAEAEEAVEAEELDEGVVDGEDETEIIIENENEGTLTNQADVLADTGENQANENGGEATIETGDALAYANLLNLLNSNVVGSDFYLYLLNLLEGQEGDINLNEIWKEIVESGKLEGLNISGEESLDLLLIQNSNLADLENEVNVTAATGENQANENGGEASIYTGDATALANVVNFVNINLVGSKFFLGVVNIFGSFLGDLILPRPERFISDLPDGQESEAEGQTQASSVVFENQNLAEIQDEVLAVAESGANETNNNEGNSFIGTGDASSFANTFSLVNTNIQRNNWFFLIVNNLGPWWGKIFGWSAPDAVEESGEEGPAIYQLGLDSQNEQNETDNESEPQSVVQNQNQAQVSNDINVLASTGQNQANENSGDAEIITGRAQALANLFNFVNLNILGSHWFLGLVNVLGDWQGNTIFAYPDVTVSLTNGADQVMVGETVEYILSYQNQGYDEANNVWVGFELPQGLSFLGDSSGLTPEVSGQTYSWFLGTLGAGEEGAFTVTVMVDSDFSFEEPLSFWSKIIPQAHAAENGQESEVVVSASIGTTDPESDLSNNSSSVATVVYLPSSPQPEEEGGADQGQPILEISAWNNVGEFVYPGDTVTFEIIIKNTGEVPSYDTRLVQKLFDGGPEGFGVAEFELGTIEPGKGGKLSFGLALADDGLIPAGFYFTVAQAIGYAPNGDEVSSNEARTDFEVRLREATSLFEAKATEEGEGEIFGAVTEYPECKQEEDILPYVLLLLLSSLWIVNKGKRKLLEIQGG